MPYTLAKALIWLVLAGVLGLAVGWLLRSVTAKRQLLRARGQHVDGGETDRLRARVRELEAAVADRDRVAVDRDRLARELEASRAATSETPSRTIGHQMPTEATEAPARTELDAAAAVLGHPIEHDDLKVIEGIGPSIEDLCHGIGIRTWSDMAATETSLLRTMLTDAGPRFKMHDPSTWPRQAELLASGRWETFRDLVGELRGGVTSS